MPDRRVPCIRPLRTYLSPYIPFYSACQDLVGILRSGVDASDPGASNRSGNGDSSGGVLSDPACDLELFASVLRAEIRDDARRDAVRG